MGHLPIHSLICSHCSPITLPCSARLASLARSAALTPSLPSSWKSESFRWLLLLCFFLFWTKARPRKVMPSLTWNRRCLVHCGCCRWSRCSTWWEELAMAWETRHRNQDRGTESQNRPRIVAGTGLIRVGEDKSNERVIQWSENLTDWGSKE